MSHKHKMFAGVAMLLLGSALFAWNLRDPDAAYREPPKVEKTITAQQAPKAVQDVIKRVSAGGRLYEVQEETRGKEVKYEIEVIRGNIKFEYEVSPDGVILEQDSKRLRK